MKERSLRYATAALAMTLHAQRRPVAPPDYEAFYELGPDSLVRRGVPKGAIKGPSKLATAVFPGTDHDYWIYVPAQYDGRSQPDGLQRSASENRRIWPAPAS